MVEDNRAKLLRIMGKTACIFGVPALTALFLGLALRHFWGVERTYILLILGVSFIFSWVLMWRFYRSMRRAKETTEETVPATIENTAALLHYDAPLRWESKK